MLEQSSARVDAHISQHRMDARAVTQATNLQAAVNCMLAVPIKGMLFMMVFREKLEQV